jgi:hypothetical protein
VHDVARGYRCAQGGLGVADDHAVRAEPEQ